MVTTFDQLSLGHFALREVCLHQRALVVIGGLFKECSEDRSWSCAAYLLHSAALEIALFPGAHSVHHHE